MTDKYANKTPVMRFVHKNTGFIICGVILAFAVPMLMMEYESYEFFERWTCPVLWTYVLSDNTVPSQYPKVSELTPEQKGKLDIVMTECVAQVPANNTVLRYEK